MYDANSEVKNLIRIIEVAKFGDNFKELIQRSKKYERIIEDLMNDSKVVFPNRYRYISEQHSHQCDFEDVVTMQKYDAKLLFAERDGKLLGSRNGDYSKWCQLQMEQVCEFGDYIENRGQRKISDLTFYKIACERLKSVEVDEDVIFFIPYPIVLDGKEFEMLHFCGDMLSAIFGELQRNGLVGDRKVYAIYPCVERAIVLRCLNTDKREYFTDHELRKYIAYDISLSQD